MTANFRFARLHLNKTSSFVANMSCTEEIKEKFAIHKVQNTDQQYTVYIYIFYH